jgi:hypothetical protein
MSKIENKISNSTTDYNRVLTIAERDVDALHKAGQSYGDSWKSRGGVGAFMMLARKWDRIENQCKDEHYDIFKTYFNDKDETGVIDDIRDLRRYLLLVEEEITRG